VAKKIPKDGNVVSYYLLGTFFHITAMVTVYRGIDASIESGVSGY
jgi:hypothetical protein